ncbi:MAG: chemotaxis-specific protein-glutamate methyltransferase CheB [Desulfobacterales bacterium]|jgi:two-component system chemotaxis response regulator CheB|nr:chemotaxis-specific protein-glutamate methyltransferase CheB [Desulfobacterales bacterium]
MRKSITYLLESERSIEVAGTAADGVEAIQKVSELHPDVVLLDIEMPRMDGFSVLKHIMAQSPTPVVMLSALNKRDSTIAIKSLEHGAVDFIAKPSGVISYDIDKIGNEIITKVKMAADVDVHKLETCLPDESFQKQWPNHTPKGMVVIGASTGGPRAITTILSNLPRNISTAILVVQHMSSVFIPSLVNGLGKKCSLEVSMAQEGEVMNSGRVLVAPGEYDTAIVREGDMKKIHLVKNASPHSASPSINYTMESAAEAYGDGALGVLLTGMGMDGARGMKAIKDAGGSTIAEDQSTCIVFGMPRAVIEMGCVDTVVPLPQIARTIIGMI